MKTLHKSLRSTGIIMAVTLAILAAIELAARAVVEPPPQSIYDRTESFDVPAKAPQVFRVVAIGASTVVGWPMPEMGFTAQLESALKRLQPESPVEVINLGFLGKSSEYVRQMVEGCERYEPDCIVVLAGHNEYLNRADEDQSIKAKLQRTTLRLASIRFLLSRTGVSSPPLDMPKYQLPEKLVPCDRANPWFASRIERHRRNMAAAAAWARSRNIPFVLCTLPADIAGWPPVYRLVAHAKSNPNYDADVATIDDTLDSGDTAGAERAVNEALDRYGEDAMMLYLKGQVYRQTGRLEEAREVLVRAKDLDPFPQRVLSVENDNIREVARKEGAVLADVAGAFDREATSGLVGMDLIGDNVHPTTLGYALVAREIVRAMSKNGIFLEAEMSLPLDDPPERWMQAFLADYPSDSQKRWYQFKIADAYSTYCQKYPFFHFDLALEYKRKAVELAESIDNTDWGLYGELGTLLILTGDVDAGVEELRRATAMKGSPLDPSEDGLINWLPEALAKAELSVESLGGTVK